MNSMSFTFSPVITSDTNRLLKKKTDQLKQVQKNIAQLNGKISLIQDEIDEQMQKQVEVQKNLMLRSIKRNHKIDPK